MSKLQSNEVSVRVPVIISFIVCFIFELYILWSSISYFMFDTFTRSEAILQKKEKKLNFLFILSRTAAMLWYNILYKHSLNICILLVWIEYSFAYDCVCQIENCLKYMWKHFTIHLVQCIKWFVEMIFSFTYCSLPKIISNASN